MKKLSLYSIVSIVFAILAANIITITYLSVVQRERELIRVNIAEKMHLAETINQVIFHPHIKTRVNLLPQIGRTIIEEMSKYRDVTFIRIIDIDGKVLQSSVGDEVWQTVPLTSAVVRTIADTKEVLVQDEMVNGEKIKSIILPSLDNRTASWIGFSLRGIKSEVRSMFLQGIMTGLLNLLLIIVTVLFILKTIVNPVKKMAAACEHIRTGGRNVKIDIPSTAELGKLANTFNAMIESLHGMQEKAVRSEKLAAIGKLTSGIGHELRNPLASISNISFYFNRYLKSDEPKIVEFKKVLSVEVDRANNIVNELLDYSRIKKLSKSSYPVHTIIEESLQYLLPEKNIKVIREFSPEVGEIYADADKIRQVFNNLVSNAEQAMAAGGILAITTEMVEDSGVDYVRVSLRDNGAGMSKDTLAQIFEPLFTTKPKGIGLGLPIVKEIIELHHGKILVESELAKGTIFRVLLPVKKIDVREAADNGREDEAQS